MKKFFKYIKKRPLVIFSIIVICFLYIMMIFAEFNATVSSSTSYTDKSYHPSNLKIKNGRLVAQEARVINKATWQYAFVKDLYHPVQFFVKGESYKLWGIIPSDIHFIGVKDASYPLFIFGADNLGRDIYSRIVYGSRISLTIGFVATAISLFLAILLGGLAGYYGGAVDWTIMRISEFFMLIPGLYLILFLRSLLSSNMDSGQSYMVITLILSLVGWPGTARTIRGLVHSIKREDFVLNAQNEGVNSVVIIFGHIIPQIASLLIISVALSIPGFIMSETTLSYLGLGISDPAVSWGSLINRDISTLSNLKNYPWLLTPVWYLLVVTLSFNFFADGLRDFFDPYHRLPSSKFKDLFFKKKDKKFLKDEDKKISKDDVLLKIKDFSVTFPIFFDGKTSMLEAVKNISFEVKKGEILGIVGESGSGKSVSTTAILGLLSENAIISGSILFDKMELTSLDKKSFRQLRGKRIGIIYQEPSRAFDPLQNLESVFFETLKNSNPKLTKYDAKKQTIQLLKEVGLPRAEERLSNFPHQFSGGQLQRICIALSLAQNCELLIADEPTTALDVTIQKQIVSLLLTLKEKRNLTVIFISHDIDLVSEISDRIIVMQKGKIVESGKTSQIINEPCEEYTKKLIASSPVFGQHISSLQKSEKYFVKIENLKKKFNIEGGFFGKYGKFVYAVNDLSFEIGQNETYALVGESGCGKTTTARLLVGMYKKDDGKIVFGQNEISKDNVKYIFQDPARSLNPRKTIESILTEPIKYSGRKLSKKQMHQMCVSIMEEVGLEASDLERRPADFSGGQRQRICIARSLLLEPELLICDEVVSALDVSIQAQILDLLLAIRQKRNLSMLFITHDLKVACYFSNRIGVMYKGVLMEEATSSSFYKECLHSYSQLLFQSAPESLRDDKINFKNDFSSFEKNQSNEELSDAAFDGITGCPFASRCPKATEKCFKELPKIKTVSELHKVRCWKI